MPFKLRFEKPMNLRQIQQEYLRMAEKKRQAKGDGDAGRKTNNANASCELIKTIIFKIVNREGRNFGWG
jgi:hypothetical protein